MYDGIWEYISKSVWELKCLLKVCDALCMIVYNSTLSNTHCGSINACLDALARRCSWSTILVIVSACLRFMAFPNRLFLFLWGLLEANGFFNVDLSTDWEMSQFLGLWGGDFILSFTCATVGVAVSDWGGVGDLADNLSWGNLSLLLENLEVGGSSVGREYTGGVVAIAESKIGWDQSLKSAWAWWEYSCGIDALLGFGLNEGIHVDLS